MHSNWTYVRLYYEGDPNKFLKDQLFPLIRKMEKLGMLQVFFFVRYSDPKPHIRFRFRPLQNIDDIVVTLFCNHLEHTDVLLTQYIPEIDRYGGPRFMEIVENQFYYSSYAIRELVEQSNTDWSYEISFGAAVEMHLALLKAFKFSIIEVKYLLGVIINKWLKDLIPNFDQIHENALLEAKIELISNFSDLYQKSESLKETIQSYWLSLDDLDFSHDAWLQHWITSMHTFYNSIEDLRRLNSIKLSDHFLYKGNQPLLEKRELFSLCDSLIHMTNNRLGIPNQDESYLAFVLLESFKGFTE